MDAPGSTGGGGAALATESMSRDAPVLYKSVYLWHWPIRAMHWIAAACIVVLIVTGFYIGRPYFYTSGNVADQFLMGRFRFAHFAAAGVLVATAILRAYWLFAGNKFERFRALFPVRKRDWVNLYKVARAYLFIRVEEAPQYLGHHPLQQLSYTGIYALAALQVVTGFYLYGLHDPSGLFFTWFAWVGSSARGRADRALRAPRGHLVLAHVHPGAHIPLGARRRAPQGEHGVVDRQRQPHRAGGRGVRR
jgi:Ni/Fe-hydrogenase b-type cytochrome subunit